MDNLEKQLYRLPQFKLGVLQNNRNKARLYRILFSLGFTKGMQVLVLGTRMKQAVAIFSIIALLFTSTSVYAYTSSSVIEGHSLYLLKRGIEKAEVGIAVSDIAKTKVYTKHSERRLKEALSISMSTSTKRNEYLNHAIEEAGSNLDKADSLSESAEETKKAELIEAVNSSRVRQLDFLVNISNSLGEEMEDDDLDEVENALDELEIHLNKDRNENEDEREGEDEDEEHDEDEREDDKSNSEEEDQEAENIDRLINESNTIPESQTKDSKYEEEDKHEDFEESESEPEGSEKEEESEIEIEEEDETQETGEVKGIEDIEKIEDIEDNKDEEKVEDEDREDEEKVEDEEDIEDEEG